MGQLDYDNSAFYYFMIAMLSVYLIPGYFYTMKYTFSAFAPAKTTHRSKLEQEKENRMKTNLRGMHKLSNRTFVVNVCLLGATTLLFAYLVYLVSNDSSIASFDPYTILSLDRGATDKQIKKAYKLKALEFHPDKNIGDEKASQMFMMVAKAYEALTDEVAKENWEKYGNPDGKQSFEMSIGLPTFLMEADNHNLILLVYLIVMVIVVPVVVYMYYTNSQLYGENNIMYRTLGMYQWRMLRGPAPPKLRELPEIYVSAAEFDANLKVVDEDMAIIEPMLKAFNGLSAASTGGGAAKGSAKKQSKAHKALASDDSYLFMPKASKFLEDRRMGTKEVVDQQNRIVQHKQDPQPMFYWRTMKGALILHHHLGRTQIAAAAARGAPVPSLPAAWEKTLDMMLVNFSNLLGSIVSIASDYPHQNAQKSKVPKFETVLEVMHFSQCITQGVLPCAGIKKDMAPFYQLPHITAAHVATIMVDKRVDSLRDFVRLPYNAFKAEYAKNNKGDEKALAKDEKDYRAMWNALSDEEKAMKELDQAFVRPGMDQDLSDEQRADVNAVCKILPDLDIEVETYVDDEDFVAQGDTVTLKVTLTRQHVPEGSKAEPVHAPYFPSAKEEGWWILLRPSGQNWERYGRIDMIMKKESDQGRVVVHEMKFPAPVTEARKYKYTVHVVSDSYLGLDFKHDFELQVEDAREVEMIEEEPEDDIGPEEVPLELAFGNANVDSDLSDDDDDGDDSDSEKEAKAKSPPSSPGKKGSKPSSPNKGARAGQEEGDGVLVEAEDAADLD